MCTFYNEATAQNCTVKINAKTDFFKTRFKEEMNVFLSLDFKVNNVQIKAIDTTEISVLVNPSTFDTIKYSFLDHGVIYTDQFICKLRPNEVYTISPCTCCGIFLITPSENAKRGSVKYINNSKKEFIAETGESERDTLFSKNETAFINSSISMNCGFMPNTIFVADFGYLDKKFSYENWESKPQDQIDILMREQQSYIVYSFNYLFLHQEKLLVTIDKSGKTFKLTLEN